ncbi:GTPase domain-containing protein [Streptomyces griseoaurantiacus]|uniref:GTPase domain-containing protein n=1 Tax=Streptomyces griseoaurantiacus TaxID=68213 RepID=UPI0005927F82|nr:GTPase domain-containing protein [Streptomyces griseoaurantiacus]
MEPRITTDGGPSARVLELSARAEEALNAHSRTRDLTAALPRTDTSPLRIALLGPYSAGKSTLIAALLRLPAAEVEKIVDAAPKTREATPYPWNGVILVDLPGTLSGDGTHFAAARRGVRGADALMIVTTSELPGEAETEAVLQALDADGFADRSVVVVNKMNAENSDRDVILDEIRKRLGPFADRVPIVPTDARDFLDAANDPGLTAEERELLGSGSGIDALTAELLSIVAPGVSGLRPRAQAYELLRVLADAEELWNLHGEELDAVRTAEKVGASLSKAEEDVRKALGRESEVLAARIRTAGSRIADSISEKNGTVPTDVATAAARELVHSHTDFDIALSRATRAAFDVLTAEYGDVVPEPEEWVNDVNPPEAHPVAPPKSPLEEAVRKAAEDAAKQGVGKLSEWFTKIASDKKHAAAVVDLLNKSRVGQKLFDPSGKLTNGAKKFKPWGKVKATDKVFGWAGKAQWAAMVIGPALDTVSVIQDHSERAAVDKHRKKLRDHYADVALQQRDSLVNAGEQHLRTWIAEVEQALSDLVHPGAGVGAAREAALAEIGDVRDEVKRLIEHPAG